MSAILFNPADKTLKFTEKLIPNVIADNKILIKVAYAGICGTDIHILDGEFPCKEDGPLILGHEFSGIVEKVGKNVKNVGVGDRVVVNPNTGCMICNACRVGNVHFCKDGGLNSTTGIWFDGGWQEYCLVEEVQVFKIPDSITLKQAVLSEPLSCITHTWDLLQPVTVDKRVLIMGTGIIGNLFASLLHLHGHRRVTISEPNKDRVKLTERLETGFEIISPDQLKTNQDKDPEYSFDLIIDCSGNAKAIEHAFTLLDFGGILCIFGVANPSATVSISPFMMFKKELKIIGSVINPFTFPKALAILESMGDRYIDYNKLGISIFSLHQYNNAIECLRKGQIAKAVFQISGE